ncbi:MAG TPA: DUF6152 family protein [Vicinamibacterales bacterium]|jgi:hypothetical protein|nr:DUF6152 family protein [Vicinamibacterales bacterium]
MWLLATAAPAAHHSISAVYDSRKPVTITGTVREFQFVNPHPWIGLDVAGDNGGVQPWRLELDNRWELVDIGMNAETFKPGDRIVARGSAGRDGARALYVLRLDRAADGLHYEQNGPSPSLRFLAR